jgi:hypothetical protein
MHIRIIGAICVSIKLVEAFSPYYNPRLYPRLKQKQKTQLKSLEESLNEVQEQLDLIKSSGTTTLNVNEIISAEKHVQTAIQSAGKAVEGTAIGTAIPKVTSNADIVNTMKAAEIVADAAATSAKADAMGVNDLAIASKDVVESIKASERAVQSVIDKISAESSNVDASDVESLEKAAVDLMKAMETAQSIALNVGQSAANDAASLQKLESLSYGLIQNINEAGKMLEDSHISGDLEAAAIDILEEMQSSEEIATDIANLAQADSNTVSSLNIEVNSIIDAIKFIEAGIKQFMVNPSSESKELLKRFANEALELIKMDEINADMVSEAVTKDSVMDSSTIDTLKLADISIDELVKAADIIFNEKPIANDDSMSKVVEQGVQEMSSIINESTLSSLNDSSNVMLSIEDSPFGESVQSSIDPIISSASEIVSSILFLHLQ